MRRRTRLLELMRSDRVRVAGLRRSASAASRVFSVLCERPIASVGGAATPASARATAALAGGVLRLDTDAVRRDGDLLGRLLDTFVLAQLRAELPVTAARPRLDHVRQQQGRFEVDLLAELAGGGLVGMEVKATASPGLDDARHLAGLRDRYPDRFVAGVVLHT